jgi:hypothetical protein
VKALEQEVKAKPATQITWQASGSRLLTGRWFGIDLRRAMAIPRTMLPVVVGGLVVAGCSGGHDQPQVASMRGSGASGGPAAASSVAGNPQQDWLAWARCMRDNGLNIPDPPTGAGSRYVPPLPNPDNPKVKKAVEGCQSYQPGQGAATEDPAAEKQRAQFAKCMREHGINLPARTQQSGEEHHRPERCEDRRRDEGV